MIPFVRWLDEVDRHDIATVGGKGANLGELRRAGFAVPPGFCVTTDAFAAFVSEAADGIEARLVGVSGSDLEELRRAGAEVRARLDRRELPAEVVEAVRGAWHTLGSEHAYAVRSSATAEDLPYASFAGQQESYLNVLGEGELLRRVKDCFVSLYTDRAILYRVQNGFDHHRVGLAAVVQQMVDADVAGILFTADPVTGRRDIASIDASFGLGEALVSGLVTADLYRVETPTGRIVERRIANKRLAIRSLPDGGTRRVELTADEGSRVSLTDPQLLELSRAGERIEAHFGSPQDVEWALADGSLVITQARPITSLFPLPEPGPGDDALHVYFSMSHFQVMTDAMPPLSLSVLRTVIPLGRRPGAVETPLLKSAGGRMYADLSPLLRHPLGRRLLQRGLVNADRLAAGAIAKLAERPEFRADGARFNPLRMLPAAAPSLLRALRMLAWGRPEGAAAHANAVSDARLASLAAELRAATDSRARLDVAVSALAGTLPAALAWIPQLVAGVIAAVALRPVLGRRVDSDDLAALGRGLNGNVGTDMDLAVGDLADAARASDELAARLSARDVGAAERLADAADLPGGAAFLEAWNAFLARYGARGPSEIDLSRPRWHEDPSSLLQMVVNATGHREAGAHRARYRQLAAAGDAAAQRILEAAGRGAFGWLRGPLARRFVRVSRNLTPLREHHKFLAIRTMALVKPVLLEAGEALAGDGRLDARDDIWFLSIPDILDAFDAPARDLRTRVAARRAAFAHHRTLTPPRVITSSGEIPPLVLDVDAPAGALVGSPVSAGVVEGRARVVLDPATDALEPGEILVAPFTDPGWTPLFVNAAGLVTEVGGLMTHGSVVAREAGIPAVVGVIDATTRIASGQRLRVHGSAGYVEILSDADGGAERDPAATAPGPDGSAPGATAEPNAGEAPS